MYEDYHWFLPPPPRLRMEKKRKEKKRKEKKRNIPYSQQIQYPTSNASHTLLPESTLPAQRVEGWMEGVIAVKTRHLEMLREAGLSELALLLVFPQLLETL
jgi:hypothetical protein